MRIVHDALRRDLARVTGVLARGSGVSDQQRSAVGAHLGWVMGFLRSHHESEDVGLYPFVRARAERAADLDVLDRMGCAHEEIASAISGVESTAAALAADGRSDAAARTLTAVESLEAVLLPHLREEEDDAMPVVSRLITDAEWQALEKAHNLDGKSKADLGFEGHWLIDGASPADRAAVVGLVPPVARFFLLHGCARRYRHHTAAWWGPVAKSPRRVQLENRVSVTVAAGVDEVWEVVRDVTRVGEWSNECVGAEWLGGATMAVPGARFRGRNRAGIFRWGRTCEVVSADRCELVWRTVPSALYPDSSEWRIQLAEVDGGTNITQQFSVVKVPPVLGRIYAVLIPSHRDRTAELAQDLTRLGAIARRSQAPITS